MLKTVLIGVSSKFRLTLMSEVNCCPMAGTKNDITATANIAIPVVIRFKMTPF
jgi:hypothetical protein